MWLVVATTQKEIIYLCGWLTVIVLQPYTQPELDITFLWLCLLTKDFEIA